MSARPVIVSILDAAASELRRRADRHRNSPRPLTAALSDLTEAVALALTTAADRITGPALPITPDRSTNTTH